MNDKMKDKIDAMAKQSEANGQGYSASMIAHAYIIAGLEVQEAAKSSPEASAIWERAVGIARGEIKKSMAARSDNSWATKKRVAAEVVEIVQATGLPVKKTRRGTVTQEPPAVSETGAEGKGKQKKSKDNA